MLLSTLVPAIFIVGLMQLFVRQFRWRWLSYGLSLGIAAALAGTGQVHPLFTGIEVAGLGCLITRLDPFGYWKKKPDDKPSASQKF